MPLFKDAEKNISIRLVSCDCGPNDFQAQLPIVCRLLRMIPGKDRPDYWLAKCEKPLKFAKATVDHLVVTPRFVGQSIQKGMGTVALATAYVTDPSLLDDDCLSFEKCKYVAICTAKEV